MGIGSDIGVTKVCVSVFCVQRNEHVSRQISLMSNDQLLSSTDYKSVYIGIQ